MKRSLIAAALLAAACGGRAVPAPQAGSATPPPLPADVQAVAEAVAAQAVPSPGATAAGQAAGGPAAAAEAPEIAAGSVFSGEFVSLVRSELVSRLPGRVGRIFVDAGAHVAKGAPLLALETEYLELDVKRAEADVARAKAAADEARRDLARKQGLLAKDSVAQATFERVQATAEQAAAAQLGAQAALDLARQRLTDATLVSPIGGVVAERRVDVGERLGDSTVAFVIEQLAPLKLRFRVPERYLSRIRPGLPIHAHVEAWLGETFSGRVSVVGSAVDAATRTLFVEAEFPNRDGRLRPGLFARVETGLGADERPAAAAARR
ncbi:MAG: efflux RND transporter periplasmic adaptor subunit [Vicinamibacteria bacterium]